MDWTLIGTIAAIIAAIAGWILVFKEEDDEIGLFYIKDSKGYIGRKKLFQKRFIEQVNDIRTNKGDFPGILKGSKYFSIYYREFGKGESVKLYIICGYTKKRTKQLHRKLKRVEKKT